ncbi:unnamed protein product [Mytilus coruscus]|uniref:Glycoside-hydrolase family GH114 TIM-barrel domain-containing protein n=1 Tax=Mytilus coruscus TaxID=42192 RepID=A0A6J8B146_MYTCO|nr:unnamed protein product [Mytilus coruscus]
MAWNDVINEPHINTGVHGDMFVVDLFDVPTSIIDDLHRKGKRVICYFSAGTKEDWRNDAGKFPPDGLGVPNKDWKGETWVDIRNSQVRRIMRDRIAYAKSRHCDGVDPDNVDGWAQNQAGLHLTSDNQLDYNRYLATGPALTWFNTLSDRSKESWNAIKVLFEEKFTNFKNHSAMAMMEGQILNTLKLGKSQQLEDFHSQILEKGNLLPKSEHEVLARFIEGLPEKMEFFVRAGQHQICLLR